VVPVRLKIENFRSFSEPVEITLDFSNLFCIVGENGAGKSSIIEAMIWSLFGASREGLKKAKTVMRKGKSYVEVEFDFILQDGLFRVRRRYDSKTRVWVYKIENAIPRELILKEGVQSAEKLIQSLIGTDYKNLAATSIFMQNEANMFSKLSPSARRKLMAELFDIEIFEKIREIASQKAREKKSARNYIENQLGDSKDKFRELPDPSEDIAKLKKEIESNSQRIKELSAEEIKLEKELSRLETLQETIIEKKSEIVKIQHEIEEIFNDIKRNKIYLNKLMEIKSKEEEISKGFEHYNMLHNKEKELSDKSFQHDRLQTEFRNNEKQLQKLIREKDHTINVLTGRKESLNNEIREINKKLENLELLAEDARRYDVSLKMVKELEGKEEQAQKFRDKISQAKANIDAEKTIILSNISQLDTENKALKVELESKTKFQKQLFSVQKEMEEAESIDAQVEEISESIASVNVKFESLKSALKTLHTQDKKVSEQLQYLTESRESECPLCGSMLDRKHREKVKTKLDKELNEIANEIKQNDEHSMNLLKKKENLTKKFKYLKEKSRQIDKLSIKLTKIQNEITRLEQLQEKSLDNSKKIKQLRDNLMWNKYAQKWRNLLNVNKKSIEDLGFDSDALSDARKLVHKFEPQAREFHALQKSSERKDNLKKQLDGIEQELDKVKRTPIGEDISALMKSIKEQLIQLGYDRREHSETRREMSKYEHYKQLEFKLEQAKSQIPQVEERIEKLNIRKENNNNELNATIKDIEELQHRIAKYKNITVRLDEHREQINNLNSIRLELERKRNDKEKALSLRDELQKSIKKDSEKINLFLSIERKYNTLAEISGPLGIQNWLLTQYLGAIEDNANEILELTTREGLTVRLLPEGQEKLSVRISDRLGERSYESYSGGEEFRIDFALRLALSRILAQRSGFPLRSLVIDEGFGSQDSDGLEKLVSAINDVSNEFDRIIVITHLAELRDSFPARLEVTKDTMGSKVRVVS